MATVETYTVGSDLPDGSKIAAVSGGVVAIVHPDPSDSPADITKAGNEFMAKRRAKFHSDSRRRKQRPIASENLVDTDNVGM